MAWEEDGGEVSKRLMPFSERREGICKADTVNKAAVTKPAPNQSLPAPSRPPHHVTWVGISANRANLVPTAATPSACLRRLTRWHMPYHAAAPVDRNAWRAYVSARASFALTWMLVRTCHALAVGGHTLSECLRAARVAHRESQPHLHRLRPRLAAPFFLCRRNLRPPAHHRGKPPHAPCKWAQRYQAPPYFASVFHTLSLPRPARPPYPPVRILAACMHPRLSAPVCT